jgi:hypothetical protein
MGLTLVSRNNPRLRQRNAPPGADHLLSAIRNHQAQVAGTAACHRPHGPSST